MKKIIVASKNPVKINSVLEGFARMFPSEQFEVEGVSVPSGVSDQPQSDRETYQGAWNRVQTASETVLADFWVGIEGGVEVSESGMEVFAWIVIKSNDNKISKSKTGTFPLPTRIVELIKTGKELGEATDIVFGHTNSKQDKGAIGALTNNEIDRTRYYSESVVMALVAFKNPELY